MGMQIVPLEARSHELVVESARVLKPVEAEVARAWDDLCLRHLGDRPRRFATSCEVVGLLLTTLSDGDLGAYFARLDRRGEDLARTREEYETLILSFHLFEQATWPHLRRHFGERLEAVLSALDHLYHNAIAILARAYFRELERERERFVHLLADDLRSPLAVLVASSELLLRRDQGDEMAAEEVRRVAELMRVNALRVAALIDGVLDYARLKGGKVGLRTRFDAVESARGVVAVTVEERVDDILICVRDDGGGIPADQLERVFDDHYSPPRGRPGMGLGLPSARLVAKVHGGRAWAESKPGEGARFYLRLPRNLAQRPVTREPDQAFSY